MLEKISKYRTELMGISILWIMLFHPGIQCPDSTIIKAIWTIFVSFGGGFGVDIFLMLSGFGLMYSDIKKPNKGNWEGWNINRFKRLLPSYLIIATAYYIIRCDSVGEFFWNLSFLNFVVDGTRDFWYIFAMFFCYLSFPLISECFQKIKPWVFTFVGTVFIIALGFALTYIAPDLYNKIEIFLQRIPCFLIGTYMGYLYANNMGRSSEFAVLMIASTIIGGTIYILPISFTGSMRLWFTLLSLPFLAVMTYLCVAIDSIKCGAPFRYLGKRSLQVYLVHVSFGSMFMKMFDNFGIGLLVYFSSLLIAEIVYRLCKIIK